jgi:hypothetical protein
MHMIDVGGVPVGALVKGFLDAMVKKRAETCVVFLHDGKLGVATNKTTAETMARNYFSVKDGALEVAAIALHAWRMAPEQSEEPTPVDNPAGLCSIVLCAGHELAAGKPVPWDELPEPVREAHRLVAKVVVAAAVAHQPAREEASPIVKPT